MAAARSEDSGELRLTVPPEAAGERLDRFLARALDRPRNQVQRWIHDGGVRRAGDAVPLKAAHAVAADEVLVARVGDDGIRQTLEPEDRELRVLYEDADVAVLDKPAGLSVHPGAGRATGTLAHRLLARYPETASVGGPGRPGIVHRLDKDTTGALVVARTARAYQGLAAAFAGRAVRKTYLAIVHGVPKAVRGSVTAAIGRHPQRRKEMAVRSGGRPAVTHYRVLAQCRPAASVLEIDLETGRTHQIRVHLKYLGHPLVGDPVYGEARWRALPRAAQAPLRDFPRPALHAFRLQFAHPVGGETVRVVAPVPADMLQLWQAIGGGELPA